MLRRRFLQLSGAAAAGLVAGPALIRSVGAQTPRWPAGDPFSLGVACGAPKADGFVLWTRLAPDPLSADPVTPGGMSGGPVAVRYEISLSPGMDEILLEGIADAMPQDAWSVHVDIGGLAPGRSYWYRFSSGDAVSPVGRAMTLPRAGSPLDRLRLGYVSCSNYEHGYFSAYRHLADEQPDVVLFLGDYIYEYVDRRSGTVRRHSDDTEAVTLAQYRNRYAQYRLDPDLRRLHAQAPMLVTWDDHEVRNDYADAWAPTFEDPENFRLRRAAAYRAFYEHMPVRPSLSMPNGPAMRIYDRVKFGDLAEIFMLDGRQYRSREACYGPPDKGGGHLESNVSCPERIDPGRSMMGAEQEAWLLDGLAKASNKWTVLAQDVLMAQLRQSMPDGEPGYWTDNWDGYPANRARLLTRLHEARTPNPVVLGGDSHAFWTADLKLDFNDPNSATVATEFVGTSVSSKGPPYEKFAAMLPDNPHIHYFESRKRGYVSVDITRGRMEHRFRTVSDVTDPNAGISTLKTYVVEDGKPGAIEA